MKGQLRLDSAFAGLVLSWYSTHRRPLPWRDRGDPYAVWVSEVMLQQTQVKSVLPYFERFLREFPRLEDLAAAEERKVLSLWSGLGYYRRARNLLETARRICREHGGRFPRSFEEVVRLPGIGRYTAAAVLSIALGQPHPVLDGNVKRLLARYFRLEQELNGSVEKRLWEVLGDLVHSPDVSHRVSDLNQGLMELGALICVPRSPHCRACPLKASCLGYRAGLQERIPVPRRRRATERMEFLSAVIEGDGAFLLKRNEEGPFLKGLWEFPRVSAPLRSGTAETFRRSHGLHLRIGEPLPTVRHSITFRRLTFHPVRATLIRPVGGNRFAWVTPDHPDYPCSSHVRKIIKVARS